MVLFLSGTILADLDMSIKAAVGTAGVERTQLLPQNSASDDISDLDDSGLLLSEKLSPGPSTFVRIIRNQYLWFVMLVTGLYLMSAPILGINDTPGYMWLFTWIPSSYTDPKRFLHGIGATLVTWSITNSPVLQMPFNTRPLQWLGKVSYSLYIVHGPIHQSLGFTSTHAVWRWLGYEFSRDNLTKSYVAGHMVGIGLTLAVALPTAHFFGKYVDCKVVKLCRWVEGKMFIKTS